MDPSVSKIIIFTVFITSVFGGSYKPCSKLTRVRYTCMNFDDCSQLHQSSGGLGAKVLFPCSRLENRVCCPEAEGQDQVEILTQKPIKTVVPTKLTIASNNKPLIIDDEDDEPRNPLENKNARLLSSNCGFTVDNKISNGDDAARGEFPWMALLITRSIKNNTKIFSCGGSLISDRYVLTAAHCLDSEAFELVAVRLGELQISVEDEQSDGVSFPPIDLPPEKIIKHENFLPIEVKNDIALIRLPRNVSEFNRFDIRPICLPMDPDGANITKNTKLEAAGWGKKTKFSTVNSDILQKIEFIRGDDCNNCRLDPSLVLCPLDEKQLCVSGVANKDVCRGDSGGPIMTHVSQRITQVGIVSARFSDACGDDYVPSVFTRVDKYVNWILDNMEP